MNTGQKKEIGEKIKFERKYRNLTLDDCARILGITASFLGLVERGDRCLSLDKLIKFCSVFGVSADYIIYGDSKFKEDFISIKDDIIFQLEGLTEKDYNIILALVKSYKLSSENDFPYKLRTNKK